MFGRKTLEERDAQNLGRMLRGSTKWYFQVPVTVLALLGCGFCFYMYITNAGPDSGGILFGCAGLLGLAIIELLMGFFYPLLREVGRLRREVERLKTAEHSRAT
jgi:hypothetical protein